MGEIVFGNRKSKDTECFPVHGCYSIAFPHIPISHDHVKDRRLARFPELAQTWATPSRIVDGMEVI